MMRFMGRSERGTVRHNDLAAGDQDRASGQRFEHDAPVQQDSAQCPQATDSDLTRRIISFLFQRGLLTLRHLDVEVRGGVAMVTGRVNTYHEKQLVTSCCQRVAGVLRVLNEVEVI